MKFKNNEFHIDTAQPVDAPLDFPTLCALLAACQAETPTARLARDGGVPPWRFCWQRRDRTR